MVSVAIWINSNAINHLWDSFKVAMWECLNKFFMDILKKEYKNKYT